MKSTGIIRRIDELGRIVIPKELRKSLRLRVGENIEIYVDGENIVLKKFSMMNKITDLAQELTDAMYSFMKYNILITDNHKVIACSGPNKKELINKSISQTIIEKIEKREKMIETHLKPLTIVENKAYECSYISNPIMKDGEVIGMIIIFSSEEKVNIDQTKIVEIVSSFITKYLEE